THRPTARSSGSCRRERRKDPWPVRGASGDPHGTGTGESAKKPRPLGSRGFAAGAEGLHSGTAQVAIRSLAFPRAAFSRAPDISCHGRNAARDQGTLRRITVAALFIAVLSCDAISEVQPRFGKKEKTRFVGGDGGSLCQIKTYGGPSPVLECQAHFPTQSTFGDWKIVR